MGETSQREECQLGTAIREAPPIPPTGRDEPRPFLSGIGMCANAQFRMQNGAIAGDPLVVNVVARIAQDSSGAAAAPMNRPANDIILLNEVFQDANVQFNLLAVTMLPPNDDFFSFPYNPAGMPVWTALCNGDLNNAPNNALVITYARAIVGAAGFGGRCGVVLSHTSLPNAATTRHTIAQEIGHFLGLEHTFECTDADGDGTADDGDGIADTPFDPGPLNFLINSCGEPGTCTQDAQCALQCAGGAGIAPLRDNVMSYYRSACVRSLTTEQLEFARCILVTIVQRVIDAPSCPDDDGDGYPADVEACADSNIELDCDDGTDQVHPGAVEGCNGRDDDCDPATTEGNCAAQYKAVITVINALVLE